MRNEQYNDLFLSPIIGFLFVFALTVFFLVDASFDNKNVADKLALKNDSLNHVIERVKTANDSLEYYTQLWNPNTMWLARAIYSETDRPQEMPYVAWVIRNRVELNYRGKSSYYGVIMDHKQFSAFNPGRRYRFYYATKPYEDIRENDRRAEVWKAALEVARKTIHASPDERPFSKYTLYYYSEVSMPSYRRHPEWRYEYDLVEVPNIPKKRFRFFADYDYKNSKDQPFFDWNFADNDIDDNSNKRETFDFQTDQTLLTK